MNKYTTPIIFLKWISADLAREMFMTTRRFDECDNEIEKCYRITPVVPEASPSTRLERRRKIEDLFEEKRLREELEYFS